MSPPDRGRTPDRRNVANPRVHEVAAELGIDSKIALDKLKDMGEFVKSASSSIAPPVARRLKAALEADGIKAPEKPKPGAAPSRPPEARARSGTRRPEAAAPAPRRGRAELRRRRRAPAAAPQPARRRGRFPASRRRPAPRQQPFRQRQGMSRPGAPRPGNNPFAGEPGHAASRRRRRRIPRPQPRVPAARPVPAPRVPAVPAAQVAPAARPSSSVPAAPAVPAAPVAASSAPAADPEALPVAAASPVVPVAAEAAVVAPAVVPPVRSVAVAARAAPASRSGRSAPIRDARCSFARRRRRSPR